MTKTIFTSTGIILAMLAPVAAQAQDASLSSPFVTGVETSALPASSLIGNQLYLSEAAVDRRGGFSDNWDEAGEIVDVILGNNGDIDILVVEFGGFLGLGEQTVGVDMNRVDVVPNPDDPRQIYLVVESPREIAEIAPNFDADFEYDRIKRAVDVDYEGSGLTTQAGAVNDIARRPEVSDTAELQIDPIAEPSGDAIALNDGDLEREVPVRVPGGYAIVEPERVDIAGFESAQLFDLDNNEIGAIREIILNDRGLPQDLILDLDDRRVSLPLDDVTITQDQETRDYRLFYDDTSLYRVPTYED
ncbi:PRC-barrel domain protein [Jannaschia seosinensis]|uniref:PRC-barrel domain protein n=1 Tax=Jannaschia seosinensis TaxID=313367 RepID=A0A0M7B3V0_9RHOB|nr:PRC-barrel domain-containing protein [Jannaschia seosinensis]CUH10296.1 PRC-barrel domain protein [Jannaschia seosinensis]